MKRMWRTLSCSVLSFLLVAPPSTLTAQESGLQTMILDKDMLEQIKTGYANKDQAYERVVKKLLDEANTLVNDKPLSVVEKAAMPPSGDKHDFMSMAPYFWPDPAKKDGLPYIQRDGERNPEIYAITDATYLSRTVNASHLLAIAYFVTGDTRYSARAADKIRAWFLNEATRMNPHMKHAQYIRGINEGRAAGLIQTKELHKVLEAIVIVRRSPDWTTADDQQIRQWFEEYFAWITTHQYGLGEEKRENNHGTWYDVQAASIALFLDKKEFARNVLEAAKEKRIGSQITKDGKQPNELRRTRSWHYSCMNLSALMHLALLGERVHVDLWNYESQQGGSIRKALDYLLPIVADSGKWEYRQITPFQTQRESIGLLCIAEKKFDKKIYYSDWLNKISSDGNVISVYDLFY